MPKKKYYNYKTLQGDTFDSIALDFYNSEFYASELIKYNPEHRKKLIFEEGVNLKIPILESNTIETLPPWRR